MNHEGTHVISCWGKGAVSIPIYVHANQSLSPLGPDLGPRPVRRRFCHEGDRQELPRYSRFQRFSLRQHVPSRFCGPKEHGHGDDSPRPAHRHQRRRAPDANAGAVGPGGNPQRSPCRQGEQPAHRRPRFPDVRFQLHTGSGSGARRREGQHQSRQAATAETGGAGGLQPGVPALDLHGQGLPGGRNQSRHLPAYA